MSMSKACSATMSPQFIGRVIEALALDPATLAKSGKVLVAAAEAAQYDVTDLDGTRPTPLTLAQV
jgi:hypothetical protein